MLRNVSLTVKGRVQGVFYRASAKQKADELGVSGWVKNLPDGSVYIEVEGTEEQLDAMHAWCQEGPPRADVYVVERINGELKNYKDFRIVR